MNERCDWALSRLDHLCEWTHTKWIDAGHSSDIWRVTRRPSSVVTPQVPLLNSKGSEEWEFRVCRRLGITVWVQFRHFTGQVWAHMTVRRKPGNSDKKSTPTYIWGKRLHGAEPGDACMCGSTLCLMLLLLLPEGPRPKLNL